MTRPAAATRRIAAEYITKRSISPVVAQRIRSPPTAILSVPTRLFSESAVLAKEKGELLHGSHYD